MGIIDAFKSGYRMGHSKSRVKPRAVQTNQSRLDKLADDMWETGCFSYIYLNVGDARTELGTVDRSRPVVVDTKAPMRYLIQGAKGKEDLVVFMGQRLDSLLFV